MKVWGLETTPLSTRFPAVERNKETTTKKAHSFISTVLSEVFIFNRHDTNN